MPRTMAWTIGTAPHRNCSGSASRDHPGRQLVGWQRAAPVVALGEAAAEAAEGGELLVRLDALGHHPQAHGLGQTEDRGEDRARLLAVVRQPVDERPVDLEAIEREPAEVAE